MKRKLIKLFRSFKSRILFSFFAFNAILIIWVCIYFSINEKQRHLNIFSFHLTQLQNNYYESKGNLDYFILSGFHQPSFYDSGKQNNIDLFFAEQQQIISNLEQIKAEASSNGIKINNDLSALIKLHSSLVDSVKILKEVYLKKGFKDWGAEGAMRKYAHYLEDSGGMQKIDLLMLRRHEKDYIMRQEQKYIDQFNEVIDPQLVKFASSPATLNALSNYKKYFDDLVFYPQRLSIYNEDGLYGHVQSIINQIGVCYINIDGDVVKKTTTLGNGFRVALIVLSLVLLFVAILLSIIFSNLLTRDIKELSRKVTFFIRSKFKDEDNQLDALTSKITEVERLNNNFIFLKQTLKLTLSDLENAVIDEKIATVSLEATIAKLNMHMKAIEYQKQEIENSEAKLNAFFHSSASCHIMVGTDLNIITFNKAAVSFVHQLNGKELTKGAYILLFLNEQYIDTFIDDYKNALVGQFITEERLISYGNADAAWWEISFVPAFDKDGNIFAVSFNATNINENKTHTNKIKEQNEILLKIAHIQSHEVRGPIATIMGVMNLIKEEECFTMEYLLMLEEAVNAFDKKIRSIVEYTNQVS